MFGCPPCLDTLLYILMSPYVWTPPICLDAPIYLNASPVCLDAPFMDASCIFGCPHMFGYSPVCLGTPMFRCPLNMWTLPYFWTPPYVWKMFGCPLYIHNTKKACFVTLRGVHMPHTFGWPPVCLNAPICVDTPLCLDATYMFGHPHMFGCPHMCSTAGNTFQPASMFGCPLYVLMPTYVWTPPMFGCHPLSLDTPCLFGCPI